MPEQHQGTLVVTQPPHYPNHMTRDQVKNMTAFGLTEKQIAHVLRISIEDLRMHYASEMEDAVARVNAQVKAAVLHRAIYEQDMTAATLWLINNAGWKRGDGAKAVAGVVLGPNGEALPEGGELTVVQRRETITRILRSATMTKRDNERVIEGKVTKSNGANGHGSNGANSNGVKHR